MKRLLIVAVVVLTLVSCKKVSSEEIISGIKDFTADKSGIVPTLSAAESNFDVAEDFFTVKLAREAKMKVSTQELPDGNVNLIGEIKGKDKNPNAILISADLREDNLPACVAAVKVVEALRSTGVKSRNTVRVLLYHGEAGLAEYVKDIKSKNAYPLFNLELGDMSSENGRIFVDDNITFVEKIEEVALPMLRGVGITELSSFQDTVLFPGGFEKPINTAYYYYTIDKDGICDETAAIASFVYLMN